MKHLKKLLALSILLTAFTAATFGQSDVSAASATIVSPIAINNTRALEFGNIAAGAVAGSVTLTPDAATTRSSVGVTLPVVTGTVSSAAFEVTGTPAYAYSIAISPASVNITNGAFTMAVGSFTSTPTVAAGGTLDGTTGTQNIYVGATLTVGANQAPGTYTNATAFTVTVNYN
jgi:hypothetical protein